MKPQVRFTSRTMYYVVVLSSMRRIGTVGNQRTTIRQPSSPSHDEKRPHTTCKHFGGRSRKRIAFIDQYSHNIATAV